uniref:Uncharacterized protein n=1 Tax=Oryza meridionalis TaxID=40149 RepID=A0A0E0CGP6_9ORYZ
MAMAAAVEAWIASGMQVFAAEDAAAGEEPGGWRGEQRRHRQCQGQASRPENSSDNSRGSTNRTDDGGAAVQSLSSSPALALAATDVSFLMHQTSSSHEKRRQCGTAAAAGSSGATSAATTAHAGLLRATLWAWRQSVRRSAAPAGPDMWRP